MMIVMSDTYCTILGSGDSWQARLKNYSKQRKDVAYRMPGMVLVRHPLSGRWPPVLQDEVLGVFLTLPTAKAALRGSPGFTIH